MTSNSKPTTDPTIIALEAIVNELGLHEAEHGASSRDSERWAKQLDGAIRGQLAEMQRRLTPKNVRVRRLKPIRPSLLALTRDALVAMIDELRAAGTLRYAHRDLAGLSDDDLRRLIELHSTAAQDLE